MKYLFIIILAALVTSCGSQSSQRPKQLVKLSVYNVKSQKTNTIIRRIDSLFKVGDTFQNDNDFIITVAK